MHVIQYVQCQDYVHVCGMGASELGSGGGGGAFAHT